MNNNESYDDAAVCAWEQLHPGQNWAEALWLDDQIEWMNRLGDVMRELEGSKL